MPDIDAILPCQTCFSCPWLRNMAKPPRHQMRGVLNPRRRFCRIVARCSSPATRAARGLFLASHASRRPPRRRRLSPLHPSNSFPSLTTCRLLACVHRPAGNFHGLLRRAATASFPVTCPRGHCCCQGTRSCVGGKGQGTTRGGKKIRGDAPQPSSHPCSVERNVVEHQWPGTRRGDAALH